jgi:hypothetical protein
MATVAPHGRTRSRFGSPPVFKEDRDSAFRERETLGPRALPLVIFTLRFTLKRIPSFIGTATTSRFAFR